MALSRIPTNSRVNRRLDPGKKKILFVLGFIFVLIVLYGIYNLKKVVPTNKEKIPIKIESGDRPMAKKLSIIVNGPLNMREDHNVNSKKIAQIPDKTKLEVQEELDGWYKVSYGGKDGWISKKYTVLETDQTAQKTADANTQTFQGSGYSFKYAKDWNLQNYPTLDGSVRVAISNNQLPADPPNGSYFVPIELKVYPAAKKPALGFTTDPATKKEALTVGGAPATKYTYVSQDTSTEVSIVEFEHAGTVYRFYDNGGYGDDLKKIIDTLAFN